MKKFLVMVMMVSCIATITGCGSSGENDEMNEPEETVDTFNEETSSLEPWIQEWYTTGIGDVSYFADKEMTQEEGTLKPDTGVYVDVNSSNDEYKHCAITDTGDVQYYIPARNVKNYKMVNIY